MSTFPTSIPAGGSATPSATLAAIGHTALHNNMADDIAAIATKIGTGSSTPTSGRVLRGSGTGVSGWSQVDQTTDVTGTLPIANGGTSSASASSARTALGLNTQAETLAAVYPIGCIYTETTGVNPATTFGFGTWTAFGAGRVLVGVGTSDAAYASGATGGESSHTLALSETPNKTGSITMHNQAISTNIAAVSGAFSSGQTPGNYAVAATSGAVASIGIINFDNGGGGGSHNNLQPYIVVYFWKRTA